MQRECSVQPSWSSPTAASARSSQPSNYFGGNSGNSCSSSRESSLGPVSLNTLGSAVGVYGESNLAASALKSARRIVIERSRAPTTQLSGSSASNGFGFTLRHFIVYPPEVTIFYRSMYSKYRAKFYNLNLQYALSLFITDNSYINRIMDRIRMGIHAMKFQTLKNLWTQFSSRVLKMEVPLKCQA